MKTTRWFSGKVKPVRDGLYQRRFGKNIYWAVFLKGKWRFAMGSSRKELAVKQRGVSPVQTSSDILWRGLAKEPK